MHFKILTCLQLSIHGMVISGTESFKMPSTMPKVNSIDAGNAESIYIYMVKVYVISQLGR